MLLDVTRNMVPSNREHINQDIPYRNWRHSLITSNITASGRYVLIHMVLCLEERLSVIGRGVKHHPLFVCREFDVFLIDSSGHEPGYHLIRRVCRRGEQLHDFFGGVVLSILGGVVV